MQVDFSQKENCSSSTTSIDCASFGGQLIPFSVFFSAINYKENSLVVIVLFWNCLVGSFFTAGSDKHNYLLGKANGRRERKVDLAHYTSLAISEMHVLPLFPCSMEVTTAVTAFYPAVTTFYPAVTSADSLLGEGQHRGCSYFLNNDNYAS